MGSKQHDISAGSGSKLQQHASGSGSKLQQHASGSSSSVLLQGQSSLLDTLADWHIDPSGG